MRTLAAVVAHPDDDAYGISSVVALHAESPPSVSSSSTLQTGKRERSLTGVERLERRSVPFDARKITRHGRPWGVSQTVMNGWVTPMGG